MKKILHPAESRGLADHGWLKSHHTFSFAEYVNHERMNFGALRVLNDDTVQGGKGFGSHSHQNMEIISIPLSGTLEHTDDMGNTFVIKPNDIQVMSAGTGVTHAEHNKSETEATNFLQIWILPKQKDIAPHYDQRAFLPETRHNRLKMVISPDMEDNALWINQDAYISIGTLEKGREINYEVRIPSNGVYIFVISGEAEVFGDKLGPRDAIGISGSQHVRLKALEMTAEVLVMEIPMEFTT